VLIAIGMVTAALTMQRAASPRELWTVRKENRIGSVDDPDQALTAPGAVFLAPNGMVYVTQPADLNIRGFDTTGHPVRTIGRSGEGPGEFRMLLSAGFVGDTLYVADQTLRRLSMFTADGQFVRSYEFASPLIANPSAVLLPTLLHRLLDDRTAIVRPSVAIRSRVAGVNAVPILHFDA
jgi:hypothetical protein